MPKTHLMNQTDLHAFYSAKIEKNRAALQLAKRKRNIATASILISFVLFVASIYQVFTKEGVVVYILMTAMIGLSFVFSTKIDSKLLRKIDQSKALIRFNEREQKCLEGHYTLLSPGNEFKEIDHPYSNDLDIFGENALFQLINRTVTPTAKSRLADTLLNPCLDRETLEKRQKAAEELAAQIDWCQAFLSTPFKNPPTETHQQTIEHWKTQPPFFKHRWSIGFLYFANALMLLSILAGIIDYQNFKYTLLLFIIQVLMALLTSGKVTRQTQKLNQFLSSIDGYHRLAKVMEKLPVKSDLLQQIHQALFSDENALKAFAKLNAVKNELDSRQNILIALIVNGLYLQDLHSVLRLERWRKRHLNRLEAWISAISQMEVLASMAIFRFNHPHYAVPQIDERIVVQAEELGHPLLPDKQRISNDFYLHNLHELYIVTGANMAGKSTFLRAIGINMVLALSGNVVCAKRFSFTPMRIFTSMRTTDNLSKGTSYFHAELLRLKALVEQVSECGNHFIILDEMLKGTNSVDKLNGSVRFLNKLTSLPVCGLVATHDLALSKLSEENPQHFFNICFEIEHTETDIQYDYKIKKGVSKTMNATILLEKMGLI